MEKKSIISIWIFVLIIGLVSAGIEITPPLEIYNFGDTIHSTLTINPDRIEGNFEFKLVCGKDSEILYKISPAISAFSENQEIKINHKTILKKEFLKNLSGDCYLVANLGNIKTQTEKFRITKEINTNIRLDKESYNPGESMTLKVEAIKANQKKLDGFVEVRGIVEFTKQIKEGKFTEAFTTPENLEAGEYTLEIKTYEEEFSKEILNENVDYIKFHINQIPYSVPLTLSALEVNPGEKLEIQANIFDQSGIEMGGVVNVEFISPRGERTSLSVNSNSLAEYEFPTNAAPGKWKIFSSYGRVLEEREIEINKKAILNFEFVESSSILKIKNIGNSEFKDTLVLNISEIEQTISLNIKPGEERKFTLTAPKGEHEIKVNAGENNFEKRVALTGKVISMKETGHKISDYPIIWITIIVLILLTILIIFFRLNKKVFNLNKKIKNKIENEIPKEKEQKILQTDLKNSAVSTLVINGVKEPTTIATLSLKNNPSPFMRRNIEDAIQRINKKEIAIEFKENEIVFVFSPRKTRNYKNEFLAIQTMISLKDELDSYNRKFSEKIIYGVGINSGDIIATLEKEKLKYSGVENTIGLSKKLAEISDREILISTNVKNKLLREIKTEKIEKGGNVYYNVLSLMDNKANEKKLNDLLKRTHFID